ncbi:MAG: MlaD family protein [Bacteroidales bacterium]
MKLNTQTKTGIIVVVILIVSIWGFNFLKGFNFVNKNHSYFVLYNNVNGLVKSSAVKLHGYRIGQIKDITFSNDSKKPMLVEINIEKDIRLPLGTSARISGNGVMGDKAITIVLGESAQMHVYGDTIVGAIDDDLMSMLDPMKSQAENAINALTSTLTNLNQMFDDETQSGIKQSITSLQHSLDNIEELTGGGKEFLEQEKEKVGKTLDNISEFTEMINENQSGIDEIISNLQKTSQALSSIDVDNTFSQIDTTLASFAKTLANINEGNGNLSMLIKDNELYGNINKLSKDLDYLVTDFNNNPKKYLKISAINFGKDKFYAPIPPGHFDKSVTFKVCIAADLTESEFREELESYTSSDSRKWYYDSKGKYYFFNTQNDFVQAFAELKKVQPHFKNSEIKGFQNGKEKDLEKIVRE